MLICLVGQFLIIKLDFFFLNKTLKTPYLDGYRVPFHGLLSRRHRYKRRPILVDQNFGYLKRWIIWEKHSISYISVLLQNTDDGLVTQHYAGQN